MQTLIVGKDRGLPRKDNHMGQTTKKKNDEMYNLICKEEFRTLHDTMLEQRDDIAKIRGKVFNGFDDSIKDLRERVGGLRSLIFGIYGTLIAAVILIVVERFLLKK